MALPVTYTTEEVAAALKVNIKTVRDMIRDGRVPTPARLSDSPTAPYRFTEQDVEALIAALRPVPVEKRRRKRKAA